MKLIVRQEAEKDIRAINDYTLTHWGEAQAIHYIDQIETAFLKLLDNPNMGATCGHIRSDYRKWLVENHVIYYQTAKAAIIIVRVLNQHMNAGNHFQ
jgi:toxin ParE1/3/4